MDMLSGEQITAAGLTDWRKLGQGMHARFIIGDFGAGVRFLTAIADAGATAEHYPEVRMGTAHVDLKLISDDAIYRDDAGTEHQVEWVTPSRIPHHVNGSISTSRCRMTSPRSGSPPLSPPEP